MIMEGLKWAIRAMFIAMFFAFAYFFVPIALTIFILGGLVYYSFKGLKEKIAGKSR